MRYSQFGIPAAVVAAWACTGEVTGTGNRVVATVTVAPDTARLARGGQAAFTATARDAAGAVIAGRPISWTISNRGVASISAGGVATGVGAGMATVTASIDGRTDQGVVVVVDTTTGPLRVADDFERADGPLGPNWVDPAGNLEIAGGEVGMKTLAGSSLARWQANAFGPRQFSEVVVGSLNGNTFDFFRGVQAFVRQQTTGTPWRWGFHYFSDMNRYEIKYDGGPTAETRVWATATEPLPVPGDVLRIEAVGDTIRGFVNGALKLQVIDGALDGGTIGFVVGLNRGATVLPRGVVAAWSGGER